ncbi:ectoine hydroxylase [Microbulbifer sp. TRSA002]|uniref:ectoine hydroxylase n=1 Tax=Microbulbifer sp. TRSA002 TaxID=3243382 RepID=UPI00403A130F
MKYLPDSSSVTREDCYPSRKPGLLGGAMVRKDPIVYGDCQPLSPLTPSKLKRYAEQGFVVLENLFSQAEINFFTQELAEIKQRRHTDKSEEIITEPESNEVRSVFRIHKSSQIFNRLSRDQRLSSIAKCILGDEVYIHQSRANYKPGFRGKDFYWHSDFETWHVEDGMPRMRALSISITLTENHHFNGPLMLIPKSHHHYIACDGETPKRNYLSSLKKQELGIPSDSHLRSLVSNGGISAVTGKPGSIVVFDCNLMHGSSSNISPDPRSNLFFVFNALSNKVEAPFCGLPPRPEYICARKSISTI